MSAKKLKPNTMSDLSSAQDPFNFDADPDPDPGYRLEKNESGSRSFL